MKENALKVDKVTTGRLVSLVSAALEAAWPANLREASEAVSVESRGWAEMDLIDQGTRLGTLKISVALQTKGVATFGPISEQGYKNDLFAKARWQVMNLLGEALSDEGRIINVPECPCQMQVSYSASGISAPAPKSNRIGGEVLFPELPRGEMFMQAMDFGRMQLEGWLTQFFHYSQSEFTLGQPLAKLLANLPALAAASARIDSSYANLRWQDKLLTLMVRHELSSILEPIRTSSPIVLRDINGRPDSGLIALREGLERSTLEQLVYALPQLCQLDAPVYRRMEVFRLVSITKEDQCSSPPALNHARVQVKHCIRAIEKPILYLVGRKKKESSSNPLLGSCQYQVRLTELFAALPLSSFHIVADVDGKLGQELRQLIPGYQIELVPDWSITAFARGLNDIAVDLRSGKADLKRLSDLLKKPGADPAALMRVAESGDNSLSTGLFWVAATAYAYDSVLAPINQNKR